VPVFAPISLKHSAHRNGQFGNPGLQPLDVALTNTLSGVSASAEPLYGADLLQADSNGPSPDLGLMQGNGVYTGYQGIPPGDYDADANRMFPGVLSVFNTAFGAETEDEPVHYQTPGFRPNEPSTLNTIYDYTKAQAGAVTPDEAALMPGASAMIKGVPRALAGLGNILGSLSAENNALGIPEATNLATGQSISANDIKNTQLSVLGNLAIGVLTGGVGPLAEEAVSNASEQQAWKTFLGTAGSGARVIGELSPEMLGYDGAANATMPLTGNASNALIRETGDQSIDFAPGRAAATVSSTTDVADSAASPGNSSPSQLARSWQGSVSYPGVDSWTDVNLPKGTYVVGAAPGQSEFYTTLEGFNGTDGTAESYYQNLQIGPNTTNPSFPPYRSGVTIYQVNTEALPAASSNALANPQFGPGGKPQLFIPGYQGSLTPIYSIPFK